MTPEPATAPANYAEGPALRRLEAGMLAAGLSAFGLLYITQAVLPSIGSTFGVTATTASLTVSFAAGALALTIAPISGLAESHGRLKLMRVGLVSALLLAVGCAVSTSIWELLACRALMGVALAAVVAVAMGHLGDEVHPGKVSAAMGVYVAGNTLGGVVGRLLPGAALDLGTWRFALLMFVALAALAIVAFLVLLPRPHRFRPSPSGLRPQIASARRLLADPGIRRLWAIAFLLMGGFVGAYNFLTFRLTSAPIHLSESAASRLFLAYLAGTVSSTVAGYCAGRFGRRRVLCSGIVLSLAGLALTLPNNLWCIGSGLVLFTAGFFAAHSTASGWISARASSNRAQASALYLMSYYLGSSVLGAAVGIAYLAAGWDATATTVAVLALAALLLAGGMDAGRPRTAIRSIGRSTSRQQGGPRPRPRRAGMKVHAQPAGVVGRGVDVAGRHGVADAEQPETPGRVGADLLRATLDQHLEVGLPQVL